MRKTIAGLLVLGLVVVIFFSLFKQVGNENIITQYIQLVGVIIAFYFGSRVAGVAGEKAADSALKSFFDSYPTKNSPPVEGESGPGEGSESEEGATEESVGDGAAESQDAAETGSVPPTK